MHQINMFRDHIYPNPGTPVYLDQVWEIRFKNFGLQDIFPGS